MRRRSTLLSFALIPFLAAGLFAQTAPVVTNHQKLPTLPYYSVPHFLKLPPYVYLGECVGVATNSHGDIFVYTRSGHSRLLEFDPDGNFLRDVMPGLYSFLFAHTVRVDSKNDIWVDDEGSNMIVELNPAGTKVLMTLGRRPSSADGRFAGGWNYHPIPRGGAQPPARRYLFNRETDVAWDSAGNIFVSDGYGNSRVVKYSPSGRFIKSVGAKGDAPGQFNLPHTIAIDRNNNVYVGDRSNKRIQVFNDKLHEKAIWTGMGAPWAICITPGTPQYLYSSDATGIIYKMNLQGRILGKFGTPGKRLGQFGWVHEMDCVNNHTLLVAEILNWRVQKLIVGRSAAAQKEARRDHARAIATASQREKTPRTTALAGSRPTGR